MVEIAIAILILALGVMPMLGVFIANSEETRANKNRSFAAAIAASCLERYRKFRPKTLESMFKTEIKPEDFENAKNLPETSKEIADDPILSPKKVDAKDPAKEFFDLLPRFRRVMSYKAVAGTERAGQLQCTVVWTEKAAGRERVLTYSLATLLTDPIFPTGRED